MQHTITLLFCINCVVSLLSLLSLNEILWLVATSYYGEILYGFQYFAAFYFINVFHHLLTLSVSETAHRTYETAILSIKYSNSYSIRNYYLQHRS